MLEDDWRESEFASLTARRHDRTVGTPASALSAVAEGRTEGRQEVPRTGARDFSTGIFPEGKESSQRAAGAARLAGATRGRPGAAWI